MILFLIALAAASVAFWKAAVKILVVMIIFLVISGAIMVIQDLHHVR